LVKCCCYTDLANFPASATAVNFEYTIDTSVTSNNSSNSDPMTTNTNQINNNNSTPQQQTANLSTSSFFNNKSIITKQVRLEKVHLVSFPNKKKSKLIKN